MNKKALLITIVFIVLFSLFLGYKGWKNEQAYIAKEGIIDLSGVDMAAAPIPLDGEWEFVPGKLVDANYFIDGHDIYYVEVPSLWDKYEVDGKRVSKYTSATYRLRVKGISEDEQLAIKTSNIRMSNAIYANGELIGQSGVPKENHTYKQSNTPYVASLAVKDGEIELIIHVANFDYASGGGIIGSLYLGTEMNIFHLKGWGTTYDWMTIAIFLTLGVYFFGYNLQFRKEINLIYYTLFCFSIALYTSTHGEKVLMAICPSLPYEIFQRLQNLSTIWLALFLLLFYYYSLEEYVNKRLIKCMVIYGLLLMLISLTPTKINSHIELWSWPYLLINFSYMVYVSVVSVLSRISGMWYLLIASLIMMALLVSGTFDVAGNTVINEYSSPILLFIYALMTALYTSHRFTENYLKKDELTSYLLRADKMKDEFLAKTSHEFRTPLHGAQAIIQSLKESDQTGNLTKDQVKKLDLVTNIIQRLSNLVNDILDLSKLKEGELEVRCKPVDMHTSTNSIFEIFKFIVREPVQLINQISEDRYYVMADEDRLRQILYNLVGNAAKHVKEGYIKVTCYERDGFIFTSVTDTGTGIAAEKLPHIFMPYEHFDIEGEGVGLGLNITKELVEVQGGSISVSSIVGEGTTFTFSLPVSNSIPVEENRSVQLPLTTIKKITIPYVGGEKDGKSVLIADDDHINLQILIEILKEEGYRIVAVENGEQAIEQLHHHHYSLVILDVMMPKFSGFEVCQFIRKSYSLTDLPVLMMTAAIIPEDVVLVFESGANDFLPKPFDRVELKTRVGNLIAMKEAAAQATRMELAFLQAQIKPHFIYNVFNSILSLSYIDMEKSRELILNFAAFLRKNFEFSNVNKWRSLSRELELIDAYVEIEKELYPGLFQFSISIYGDRNIFLPPLMIQPLVENAIKYSVGNGDRIGIIEVEIHAEKVCNRIMIKDNGKGISVEKLERIKNDRAEERVGLANIVKRVNQLSGSIQIKSHEGKGTTIEIIIPKRVEEIR